MTARLRLRNFRRDDWLDLLEYLSLPETYRFEPGAPIDAAEAMRLAAERAAGDSFIAVELLATGKMAGHLYLERSGTPELLEWELGYIFNPAYQGEGYCTEACRALLGRVFRELGAHKVVAHCDPRNPASWRVLEKIGMTREGHFREKAFFRRGPGGEPLWHDCWSYGLLATEYGVRPSDRE